MQESKFRDWLKRQDKQGGGPYASSTVQTYIRDAKRVEKAYSGNLDELYAEDCLAEVLQELECVKKARKSNGSNRYDLYGPGYLAAVGKYREFCDWAAVAADPRGSGGRA